VLYCAVRTGSLNKTVCASSLKDFVYDNIRCLSGDPVIYKYTVWIRFRGFEHLPRTGTTALKGV